MTQTKALHPRLKQTNWFDESFENWGPEGEVEIRFLGKLKKSGYFVQLKGLDQSLSLTIYQGNPLENNAKMLYSMSQCINKSANNDDYALLVIRWLGGMFAHSSSVPYPTN